jgi:hypothetical protein
VKEILLALFPIAVAVIAHFLGKKSGILQERIDWLRRVQAAREEVGRLPSTTWEEIKYQQGYYHAIIHVSEGAGPNDFVDVDISEQDEEERQK